MSRVLITGGAGFIGFHLAHRLLRDGHELTLLDNFARGVKDPALDALLREPGVRLADRDLLAAGSLDDLGVDFEVVYHLAAVIGVGHVLRQPYRVLRANLDMQTAVLDFAARQKQLSRIVFASTSEVYAGTLEFFTLPFPTPETTPLTVGRLDQPRTSYMLSKIYGEALCHHSGLPFTLVRPHNFYGPRMGLSHVIPELLEKAHRTPDGGRLEVYSVDHLRSFCYIDDAVEMIARAAHSGAGAGQTLNIGNQAELSRIGDLAEVILAVTGKRLEIVPLSPTPGSPERRCPDMSHTEAVTGYRSAISLREGVSRTWDWYRREVFRDGGVSAR